MVWLYGAHPDPTPGEVGGPAHLPVRPAEQGRFLEARGHGHGQHTMRLAIRLRLQDGGDSQLAHIEPPFPHHGCKGAVDGRDLGEVQAELVGGDLAIPQRSVCG